MKRQLNRSGLEVPIKKTKLSFAVVPETNIQRE
jgi:hypothetical protein